MDGAEVLGKRIREIREAKLMTLIELARRSGVSYAYLRDIEKHGRQPTGIIAHKIATGLSDDQATDNTAVLEQITRPREMAN